MTIHTQRLDLVPGTLKVLEAELEGSAALAAALGIEVPDAWPPPLYDADALHWMLGRVREDLDFETWGFRYFVLRRGDGVSGLAVGAGGFKGPPSPDGAVEIGYSILAGHRRRGLATEAVEGLKAHAFRDPRVGRVVAETLPELAPSIGVLRKTGFELVGGGSEPGVIRFEALEVR